jgi:N-6 DNA Methylase
MVAKGTARLEPGLFIREFNALAQRKHRYEVFRDFVTVGALSVHNSFRGPRHDELEAEYLQIVGRYARDEVEGFARLLGILIALLDAEPRDILGQLYMTLDLGNTKTGQFFTPPGVSELMAQLTYSEAIKTLEQPFITVSDPACGAGGMLLALVKVMLSHGHNPAERLWVQAQDIDRTAALMCYLQMALWNVPAMIVVGDTLAGEVREVFYTPAHHLGSWESKLRRRDAEAEAAIMVASDEGIDVIERARREAKFEMETMSGATVVIATSKREVRALVPPVQGGQFGFDFSL